MKTRSAVVTNNRRHRRQVTRALASLGWEVIDSPFRRPELEALLHQDVALFVVDVDEIDDEVRWLLRRINADHPRSSTLLLSCEMELLGDMLTDEGLNNFVAQQAGMSAAADAIDEQELMVTCQKLASGNIFGLKKYLTTWGMELFGRKVTSTAQKNDAIAELEGFLSRIDCYGRIVTPISMVAEELLVNAIFNAPRDTAGKAKYAHIDRHVALELIPGEEVEFSYACDGRTVGLSVLDRFGALDREVIANYLRKCFLGEQGRVEEKQGGAGLGLYMVFNSITHLSFNIEVGKCTEVIALFYVRDGARAFKSAGRSLHIFLKH